MTYIENYFYETSGFKGNLKLNAGRNYLNSYKIQRNSKLPDNISDINFGNININYNEYLQKTIDLNNYSVEELIKNGNYTCLDDFINKSMRQYNTNEEFIEIMNNHLMIKNNLITGNAPATDIANAYSAILSTIKKYTDQSFTIESLGELNEMSKM